MRLRDYQETAVNNALAAFDAGEVATLVVIPTGGGKTIVFAHVAKTLMQRGRVMVLAHRTELIQQAAQKVERICGVMPEIEKAEQFSDEDGLHGKPPIVIASVQTLNSGSDEVRRLQRFDPSEFSLVIQDEAHHAPAGSFKRCLDHFRQNPDCRILLVTATPDRADERGLAEVCDHVAFNYTLPEIIRDGFLVPIRQKRVRIEGLDFSRIHTTAGDLNAGELDAVMQEEKPLHGVAHATIEQACGVEIGFLETIRDRSDRAGSLTARTGGILPKKTLIFTVSVSHAERLAEIINRWVPASAVAVSGQTPAEDRARIIRDYAHGKVRFLCNCAIALEGFDDPGIELVSMARPTKSRPLYAQAIGRGTRPAQSIADQLGQIESAGERRELIRQSEKPRIEILDFVGNSGRHKLITAGDILGEAKPDQVVELAQDLAEENHCDLDEAMSDAEAEVGAWDDANAVLEELEAEEADARDEIRLTAEMRRRMNVVATAHYSVDPVSTFDTTSLEPESRSNNVGASPAQIRFLEKLGVVPATAAKYGRRQASAVIESLKKTRCTKAQRWKLKTLAFADVEIDGMNFEAASNAIEATRRKGAAA